MQRTIATATVARWEGRARAAREDALAVEEPCEIRLEGEPVAVVMRTPGQDGELAAGFLFTEGIIEPSDLGTIAHCPDKGGGGGDTLPADLADPHGQQDAPAAAAGADLGNVVEVRLVPGRRPRRSWQRNFFASSSCGICGKASIEAIHLHAPPVPDGPPVRRVLLPALVRRLRREQSVFEATGGLHAAAIFAAGVEASGELLVLREDVGRHNAVDKAIGHALLNDRLPLDCHLLVVSGRTSFEIVQKALVARIPVVAGVSAASSLAVELARDSNMTLVGFLRGRRMNVYAGEARLV